MMLSRFTFTEKGRTLRTKKDSVVLNGVRVPRYTNAFWTSRQRQAHSLHEVSYRACFKPQLPRFFIERLTVVGDRVYDPFSGRGTTVLEAALCGRRVAANDVNPLSAILSAPRMNVPSVEAVNARLEAIPVDHTLRSDIPLSMFYHRRTLAELLSLRKYLLAKAKKGTLDDVDRWIRMIATNRLTGHSKGFFSVYTLPPNQAMSAASQRKVNALRRQRPEYRDVKAIILRKSRLLASDATAEEQRKLRAASRSGQFITGDARRTRALRSVSIALTVTSPPFLDVVQYAQDNWLRCWFNGIDAEAVGSGITMSRTVEDWCSVMQQVFRELYRVTKKGGWVAFEVGEVRNGTVRLEEYVAEMGRTAGFRCEAVMINRQRFTKTANIWGVSNNTKGTNTNRIVLFRK
ncbi:MAG: site-specific DNA-methyltransferase [Bacteroidetes bacterium]|nr:site-specific DNA-methyltransferase [Bacteroidota bacterium]